MEHSKNNDEHGEAVYTSRRIRMVEHQLVRRGIKDEKVLDALRKVPRHRFVPERYRDSAYFDGPQPIGKEQTISQPYIVASMTEQLGIDNKSKVLEIGTGCGYQTAVLAEITKSVYTIERISELLDNAIEILCDLGYLSVKSKLGDGSQGWAEFTPYDGIIVTAAAPSIPEALIEQLANGGRMVIPVEESQQTQTLMKIIKSSKGVIVERLYEVRFVPLLGE